jgi:hypothetical protein
MRKGNSTKISLATWFESLHPVRHMWETEVKVKRKMKAREAEDGEQRGSSLGYLLGKLRNPQEPIVQPREHRGWLVSLQDTWVGEGQHSNPIMVKINKKQFKKAIIMSMTNYR